MVNVGLEIEDLGNSVQKLTIPNKLIIAFKSNKSDIDILLTQKEIQENQCVYLLINENIEDKSIIYTSSTQYSEIIQRLVRIETKIENNET